MKISSNNQATPSMEDMSALQDWEDKNILCAHREDVSM